MWSALIKFLCHATILESIITNWSKNQQTGYWTDELTWQIEEGFNQNSKPDLNKNVIQSFLVVPSSSRLTLSGKTKSSNISAKKIFLQLGINSKSVLVFLTFSKKTRFLFSYAKVEALNWQTGNSNEIDRVSKFDNFLSFGAKQNALWQIFFALFFF